MNRDLLKQILSVHNMDIDEYDLYHNGNFDSNSSSINISSSTTSSNQSGPPSSGDDQMLLTNPSSIIDSNSLCDAYAGNEFYLKRKPFFLNRCFRSEQVVNSTIVIVLFSSQK